MSTLSLVLLLLYIVFTVFCVYMLNRNTRVYKYRKVLIDRIYNTYMTTVNKKGLTDAELLEACHVYDKQYAEVDRIPYNEMVTKFWKKIDSFYNKDILK